LTAHLGCLSHVAGVEDSPNVHGDKMARAREIHYQFFALEFVLSDRQEVVEIACPRCGARLTMELAGPWVRRRRRLFSGVRAAVAGTLALFLLLTSSGALWVITKNRFWEPGEPIQNVLGALAGLAAFVWMVFEIRRLVGLDPRVLIRVLREPERPITYEGRTVAIARLHTVEWRPVIQTAGVWIKQGG
jgi:hypothetical protein